MVKIDRDSVSKWIFRELNHILKKATIIMYQALSKNED